MSISKAVLPRAGDLVDLYDEGGLACAVVLGEEKGRLKVVTESGKELRVTLSRVAHLAGGRPVAPAHAAAAARRHAAEAGSRLDAIDVAALWDVLVESPQRLGLAELAELALGEDGAVARSAMLRALHADRTYFSRKGDDYEPRSREDVEETFKRAAAERARAQRRADFLERARAGLRGERLPAAHDGPSDPHKDLIAGLVELAVMGEEAAARRDAIALLDEAGVADGIPEERAFALLAAMGIFREDENLFIHKFRLKTKFPPDVERAALESVADPARDGAEAAEQARRDLRGLCAFTIDDDLTTEMDDALSIEARDGLVRIGIHIADPARYVAAGDPVDEEAMSRAATFYFPDVKLPMMPAAIAEQAASLVAGADRPALSFLATVSPLGEVVDHEIVASTIRSRARLTYEQADLLLADPRGLDLPGGAASSDEIASALALLRPLCEALEADRIAAGAIVIRAAEVDIRVGSDGGISIRRIDDRGASRRMVAEAMILANRLAAQFCIQRGIAAIYRRQPPPSEASPGSPESSPAAGPPAAGSRETGGYDPVAVRALRRRMRRAEVGLQPAPHFGLGLPAYTQATSPIRRYQDLVVHRQIRTALRGLPLPYDAEALARIAAATEEAERAAREAERGTDEYWILKHYERRAGEDVEGVVVTVDQRRTEVELCDTLYTVSLAPRPEHRLGDRLRLRVEASRPRARRLVLREAGP